MRRKPNVRRHVRALALLLRFAVVRWIRPVVGNRVHGEHSPAADAYQKICVFLLSKQKVLERGLVMSEYLLYQEHISSKRTTALFATLTALSVLLLAWHLSRGSAGFLRGFLIFLVVFFLFSSLNYRMLHIQLTPQALKLRFGIFSWTVPLDNVAGVQHDALPWLMRNGGAGVHFMTIRGRYRVSFNVLEFPRVVVALRTKVGPVRDVSFTTRHPDQLIERLATPHEPAPLTSIVESVPQA